MLPEPATWNTSRQAGGSFLVSCIAEDAAIISKAGYRVLGEGRALVPIGRYTDQHDHDAGNEAQRFEDSKRR